MDNAARLQVFQAQTKNVRMLDQARKQISRAINHALRRGDTISIQVHTKVLALVFCAWVEANFSKVIHTPYGFTLDEIYQIKQTYQKLGLEEGWNKCIELGLRKISNARRSNYIPNISQKITSLVNEFIVEPSLIRNKVAHGQWKVALNRENTAVNSKITKDLDDLDSVVITKWFGVHNHLLNIVESLIESPNRSFHKDYWKEIAELEDFLEKSKRRNLSAKIKLLQKKPIKKI
jgi:hypothetical protein